ncbi:MAG: CBO0543 family protein [Caulobacteraceae bacterium]
MEEGLKFIVRYEKMLFQTRYEIWLSYGVFSIRWWVLLVMITAPWFIWYRLIDKKRLQEMVLYLFATSFIAVLLDEIGTSITLWAYPINLVPIFPWSISANYSSVPIIFTLVYQYFPGWKSFIYANIILSLIFSLVLEPILVWAKLYSLISWKHIYSVPVYFFAAIILKWFSDKIRIAQKTYREI